MIPTDTLTAFLAKVPLFSACQQETLSDLISSSLSTTLQNGRMLEQASAPMLGVLLEGSLEIISTDSEKPVILRSLRACGVFGAASLFTRDTAPLSTIVATAPCHLLLFPRDAVRKALAADGGFLDAFLAFLADRVAFLNREIRCFTAGSAERRLALWLVSNEQDALTLPSITALSEMLDIGRASLYRALDKLKGEGLIAQNGREITLLNRNAMIQKYQ